MSQAPFVQPKARVQALRQLLEGLQHVDLYDCIYRILSSGIKNTDQMNIMEGTDTMDETIRSETEQYSWFNYPHTLIFQMFLW